MDYPNSEGLAQAFKTNHWLIHKLVDGLTHEDSILQPPYNGNCLNWVLGHILVSRHQVLKLLGAEKLWTEDEVNLYKTGSSPVTGEGPALSLSNLLDALDVGQDRISEALEEISDDDFNQVVETGRGIKPAGKHIYGLNWHETYHIGQLELLREVINSA